VKGRLEVRHASSFFLLIIFFGAVLSATPAGACSTFMLSRERCLIVGHNLDQSFYTPGIIHVNPGGERKRSVSGFDLELREVETPILEWVSKYGSVTFSYLGRNLPDCGMNEAGLTVSEMALAESAFPFNDSLPSMIVHQWIQYQLDNFETVGEVLEHLHEINIEPVSTFTPPSSANYHFFVTDARGEVAIIEFIEGRPRVYTGESVPVPALCNTAYNRELERLNEYRGIGGWFKRRVGSHGDDRFIRCAEAIEKFGRSKAVSEIDFCFDLLAKLQFERTKQWSIAYDVLNRRVYFRTAGNPGVRYFDMASLDFSAGASPLVFEDIDVNVDGDISDRFVPFTEDSDRRVIDRFLRNLVQLVSKTGEPGKMDLYMRDNYGFDVSRYVDRAVRITELIRSDR